MGLIVDVPKQGHGTSNDGNTARRFFENPKLTTQLLQLQSYKGEGLVEELVSRFAVLLQTINSGFHIYVLAFKEYSLETAKLYLNLFPWYTMPPFVHKLLIHGSDIIANAKVPIGAMSEEPQETRNKDIKRFREMRARKCSK